MQGNSSIRSSASAPLLIVVAGCLVMLISMGVRAGFGLFLQPVSTDLGWGREIFALSLALQNLFWGASQPFVGAISDKYGSGRTIATGGLIYAMGVYLMSGVETPIVLHLGNLLVGFGLSGTALAVVLGVMVRAVPVEKRSLVLGIGTAASSLGQFTMIPLGQFFISTYGWSTALLLISICCMIIAPCAVMLTGRSSSDVSRSMVELNLRQTLTEAFGHRGYLLLVTGFFVCGFHVAFVATHLPAYIVDKGFPANLGAWALAVIGLFNIIGCFTSGILGGRYSKKYCLSFIYLSRAFVFAIFLLIPVSATRILVFSAALGLLWLATVPLTSGIVLQIFGPKYLATLFGVVFFSHQIGSFLGAWLGGFLYDRIGSYEVAWWISVALGVASAIVHWPINEQTLRRPMPA